MRACLPHVFVTLLLACNACGEGYTAAATCAANGDCFSGYACDLAQSKTCLRACTEASSCLNSERCDIPADATQGVCRFSS